MYSTYLMLGQLMPRIQYQLQSIVMILLRCLDTYENIPKTSGRRFRCCRCLIPGHRHRSYPALKLPPLLCVVRQLINTSMHFPLRMMVYSSGGQDDTIDVPDGCERFHFCGCCLPGWMKTIRNTLKKNRSTTPQVFCWSKHTKSLVSHTQLYICKPKAKKKCLSKHIKSKSR